MLMNFISYSLKLMYYTSKFNTKIYWLKFKWKNLFMQFKKKKKNLFSSNKYNKNFFFRELFKYLIFFDCSIIWVNEMIRNILYI